MSSRTDTEARVGRAGQGRVRRRAQDEQERNGHGSTHKDERDRGGHGNARWGCVGTPYGSTTYGASVAAMRSEALQVTSRPPSSYCSRMTWQRSWTILTSMPFS